MRGLTTAEALVRLARFGANQIVARPSDPAWRRLLAQFVDPLVFLLGAAAAISLATWGIDGAEGVPFEAVVIGQRGARLSPGEQGRSRSRRPPADGRRHLFRRA